MQILLGDQKNYIRSIVNEVGWIALAISDFGGDDWELEIWEPRFEILAQSYVV
jgi:hypothetical protein